MDSHGVGKNHDLGVSWGILPTADFLMLMLVEMHV